MFFLTEDSVLICEHKLGKVQIEPTQSLVTINGRRALIRPNPEARPIKGCPNLGPTIKPCTVTWAVERGYSAFIRIKGIPVCLDSVRGLTDGTPQGAVEYIVADPAEHLVNSDG